MAPSKLWRVVSLAVALASCGSPSAPVDPCPTQVSTRPTISERGSLRARGFVGSGTIVIAPAGTPETVPQLPTLVVGVVSAPLTEQLTLAR